MTKRRASPILALLLAGCASAGPLPPPPPPPPPPPDIGLPGGEPLGAPEGDQAAIDRYAARNGFAYDDDLNRLALLSLLARRAEAGGLPGYQAVGRERGMVYINVRPPYDRAAILALAAPELRPLLQIRAVRWSKSDVAAAMDRIWTATRPVMGSATLSYDPIRDRFEIGSDGDLAQIRAALPADLADYTDVFAGGEIILVGAMEAKTP